MNDLNQILEQVYSVLTKKLCFFDAHYIETLRIFQTYNNYKQSGKTSLAINSVFIFTLILEEEHKELDDQILFDFMLLLSCLFYSYGLYDAIHDHKKTEVLSCANVLFKEALLLAAKYGLEISKAVDLMEQYNRDPLKLKIGKIDMQYAATLDHRWYNIKQGFYIAVAVVEQFTGLFIPGAKKNWPVFYENYLVYNQIMDDFSDFADDYSSGSLKSFGIFALLIRFKDKKFVDLDKSIDTLKFQLFIMKNCKELHQKFLERFYEYIAQSEPVEEFKERIVQLRNMDSLCKKELIL